MKSQEKNEEILMMYFICNVDKNMESNMFLLY